MTRTLALLVAMAATPAFAIQCPDGRWMDSYAHCDYEPTVKCSDGSYRDKYEHCPVDEVEE